jgi:hypothetical protein
MLINSSSHITLQLYTFKFTPRKRREKNLGASSQLINLQLLKVLAFG